VRCLSLGDFPGWLWVDTDPGAIFAHPFVTHDAVNFCEDRKVASHTDIDARMDTGTELANDDVPCSGKLAGIELYPASLARTVPTIAA
jgi:hypothetical protein